MIKIEDKNADKINEALKQCNGKAIQHTFNNYSDILQCLEVFNKKLGVLPVKLQTGCFMFFTSGEKVANSYKYSRQATQISIIKKSSGCFLDCIRPINIYKDGGKNGKLNVTVEALDYLINKIKDNYIVIDKV